MKVLVVARVYPPSHSGAGLRAHRTYKRLKEKFGVEPSVLSILNGCGAVQKSEFEGITVYRFNPGKWLIQQIYRVKRFITLNNLNSCDIVHCFGSGYIHIAAAIWAKLYKKKLIMELTMNEQPYKNSLLDKIRYVINYMRFFFIQTILQKRAHLLIALNPNMMVHFLNKGIPPEKVWLRPNPVDLDTFYMPTIEERRSAREKLGIKDHHTVHLLLGGFNPRKNQKFALEYISKLPKHHRLILAGPVDNKRNDYFENVENVIKNSHLENRVRILKGFQSDVKTLYHAADFFPLPSLNEGTPNVILEALCCGIPVLINENLGLNHIVFNSVNGWNLPLQADLFARYSLECERTMKAHSVRAEISRSARDSFGSDKIDLELYKKLKSLNQNRNS
jgi:glycosyltransferase involved in cell wall biosynthesis